MSNNKKKKLLDRQIVRENLQNIQVVLEYNMVENRCLYRVYKRIVLTHFIVAIHRKLYNIFQFKCKKHLWGPVRGYEPLQISIKS